MNNLSGKTITNPLAGDTITFIETSADTSGARTVMDATMEPMGAGPPYHYHKAFSEKFEVLEGELMVKLSGKVHHLKKGDAVVAEVGMPHKFYSKSANQTKFRVTLEPGHEGFENGLAVFFGMARDGALNKKGMPKKFGHMAILYALGDSNTPGFLTLLGSVLKAKAKTKKTQKIQEELIERYCN